MRTSVVDVIETAVGIARKVVFLRLFIIITLFYDIATYRARELVRDLCMRVSVC